MELRAALALSLVGAAGCPGTVTPVPVDPTPPASIDRLGTRGAIDKIDLLLAIDNSRSMADKQEILALAVPDLVSRLVNPRCVDAVTGAPSSEQPGGPTLECPPGARREFEPIVDIHVGVVSSSIGSAGGSACIATPDTPTLDDHGRLLARQIDGGVAPTYQEKGFLAWDPTGKLSPPGEASLDNLIGTLTTMVRGVGQVGCGYEAQLESWYRFLVDPEPYGSLSIVDGAATPSAELDEVLLAQRRDFLRPDSLLSIILLTDENDCSIKEYGQFYFAGQLSNGNGPYHLPPARVECAQNPNDPCCKSCGQDPGTCPDDPTCSVPLGSIEDHANLRCFDQKRRFGIDFLYPISRYVDGLNAQTVVNRAGELVPNPLFSDLVPTDDNPRIRDPGLIYLAGIVGVPWQDIARDPTDPTKGFKDADELQSPITEGGPTTWDVILGDPENHVYPLDPLMIESYSPRMGANPITGDPIAPPGSPSGANPINGHEFTIGGGGDPYDDLQYACIFPLPVPRDCSGVVEGCDCGDGAAPDNPICEGTMQVRAKAYPGIRELALLRDVGPQGVVASVCPSQVNDPAAADFGYRPAIEAIVDRLTFALLSGLCLPRTLAADADGRVDCRILEAIRDDAGCTCDPTRGRAALSEADKPLLDAINAEPYSAAAGWNCFCEVTQLADAQLAACQSDVSAVPVVDGESVDGWCYIDATTSPPTGNPELVDACPETEKRILRFVGEGEARVGATLFITCNGE